MRRCGKVVSGGLGVEDAWILVGKTYVMRHVVRVWKKSATEQRALPRKLPMRLHRAKRPRKREQAPKKAPMRTKANMKRVS